MSLVKFFPRSESVDKNNNAWVRMAPQQRCILQVASYKEGVLVVYEKYTSQKDEWDTIKKGFEKATAKY